MIILAIESSCDETGVGIARLDADGTITLLADEVASSVDEHARFGGVVPEIASRARLEALGPRMRRALRAACVDKPDVVAATIASPVAGKIPLSLEVSSRGVAPFYYDWPIQVGLLPIKEGPRSDHAAYSYHLDDKLSELLPAEAPYRWTTDLDLGGVPQQDYVVAVRIPNPLPGGRPLKFANAEQEHTGECWLPLGRVSVSK